MRYISLFSGIEAASVAWQPLGWQPLLFSENDPFANDVLAARFPEIPNVGDITKYDWKQQAGKCEIVIGGSPCQSYSLAGKRKSLADTRGSLALKFVEVCNDIDAPICIFENVPGFLSTSDCAFGRFIARFTSDSRDYVASRGGKFPKTGFLSGDKRSVAWAVLDACNFGVPQRRKRLFCLAIQHQHSFWRAGKVPNPAAVFHKPPGSVGYTEASNAQESGVTRAASQSTASGVVPTVTAKWAKNSGDPAGDECQNVVYFHPTQDVSIAQNVAGAITCGSSQGQASAAIAVKMEHTKSNGWGISSELAHTLQTGSPEAVFQDQTVLRRLTPRECERLQGFPDDWTLVPYGKRRGKVTQEMADYQGLSLVDAQNYATDALRYKAIGNSMAVPVIWWLGKRIEWILSQLS